MSRFSEIIELAAENAMINMVPTACPPLPGDDRVGAFLTVAVACYEQLVRVVFEALPGCRGGPRPARL
jgi:hypothetical protein